MHINQLLTPERTLVGVPGGSKKRVLEYFSKFIAQQFPELNAEEVFNRLIARERLGSTSIGDGLAIPHCRLAQCDQPIGTFLQLKDKVDFDSLDSQPVDLVFLLLVPEEANEAHLQTLAILAETFVDETTRKDLRKAQTSAEAYQILVTAIEE